MTVLNVQGRSVTVSDDFLKLSPSDQQRTVDEIASTLPDPISPNNLVRSLGTGVPVIGGLLNKMDAATNAALAPVVEPFLTPSDSDISRHGETFSERFAKSLAMQEGDDQKFHADHPVADTVAKATGAIASTIPLMGAAPGAFGLDSGLVGQIVKGAASNATLSGADAATRGEDPVGAAFLGGALGAGVPAAGALLRGTAAPIISNISARIDPQGYARRQVARGIVESGRSASEIADAVTQAADEGQSEFNVADAMGNPGQRLLSTVARAPGEGRTAVVSALNDRQADQGRRLAAAFQDGFGAPTSAEAARASMVDNANFEAGRNYAPVKRDSTPIDVSNPVAVANAAISPAANRLAIAQGALPTDLAARAGIESQEAALRDPIGSALKEARSYLAAPTLTSSNVNQAFRAKTNIDQMIATATEKKQGALVSELMPIQNALDRALARTSTNYASARDAYREAQQRINALDLGKELGSKPVRPEDAIRQFNALSSPEEQQAFRVGYADPYVRDVQNAAFGTDKSRPLTSNATKLEFNAFAAPGRAATLQRQIGREQTMFESRNAATGGSKTADNLADADAMSIDPSVVGHLVAHNYAGALSHLIQAGSNALHGNTPTVRKAVADILLQHGQSVTPERLDQIVGQTVRNVQIMQRAGATARGTAATTAAVLPNATQQPQLQRVYVTGSNNSQQQPRRILGTR